MKSLIIVISALLTVGGAMACIANDNIDEQVSKEYYEELYHNECMETYGSEFICKDVITAEQNEELARKYSNEKEIRVKDYMHCKHGKEASDIKTERKGKKGSFTYHRYYTYIDGCTDVEVFH